MTKKLFVLKEDHIKLLKRLCINEPSTWDEVPEIDSKRPYGNSDIDRDVCEIISEDHRKINEEDSGYSPELLNKIQNLQKEIGVALQIFLKNAKIDPGEYVCDEYSQNWDKK